MDLIRSAILKEFRKLSPAKDSVVSVGVFDGVHLGHQKLLTRLVEAARANNYLSIVITFSSNPKAVLGGGNHTLYLASLDERIRFIKDLGVDLVAAIPPDHELFQMTAEEFVRLLQKQLRMKGMVVGPDFALGKGREGDIRKLTALGKEKGFFLEVVPGELVDGEVVSSTSIRQALLSGDISRATRLLGRPFTLVGRVEAGTGKGTGIGFPTANITLDGNHALPSDGVYFTNAYFDGEAHPSVTNVGMCPTLKGGCRTIEVHVLDFKGDLYDKELTVEFMGRLRDEKKFSSVDELCDQIAKDVRKARTLLSKEIRNPKP